jgi:hypothetical protein
LFVGKLPLTIDKGTLELALGAKLTALKWLVDKDTSLFYGSAVVEMAMLADAESAVKSASKKGRGMRIVSPVRKPRRLTVEFMAPVGDDEERPPCKLGPDRPPIPVCPAPING